MVNRALRRDSGGERESCVLVAWLESWRNWSLSPPRNCRSRAYDHKASRRVCVHSPGGEVLLCVTSEVVGARAGQTHSCWLEHRAVSRNSRIQTSLDVPQRINSCHIRVRIQGFGIRIGTVTRIEPLTCADTGGHGTSGVLTCDFMRVPHVGSIEVPSLEPLVSGSAPAPAPALAHATAARSDRSGDRARRRTRTRAPAWSTGRAPNTSRTSSRSTSRRATGFSTSSSPMGTSRTSPSSTTASPKRGGTRHFLAAAWLEPRSSSRSTAQRQRRFSPAC